MAQANTARFSEFIIKLGNGATPEVFARPCGATSRGFKRSANLSDTNVPDCVDEDKPSWLERDVVSNTGSIEFAGVVDKGDLDDWDAFYTSGVSKNVEITLGTGYKWTGAFKLQDLDIKAARGERVTFSATLVSDGKITSTITP